MPELICSVEGESEGLLVDLAQGADFDSRGEFQVDLLKAREKLEVHLGLWPEDYLSFVVQAAYGLGARKLKLSATWHSLIWEFDGRSLTPPELQALFPVESASAGGEILARLQMAFFLLQRGRYGRKVFSSGLGPQASSVEWGPKGHQVRSRPRDGPWSNRLELHLPVQQLNLRWLLTRRSALFTLPEYALIRPRLPGSPLSVEVPWSTGALASEDYLFAIRLSGPYPAPEQPPDGARHVFDFPSEGDFSAWFVNRKNLTGCHCLVWGLAYPGPALNCGYTWLYSDQLRTDLAQKQVVQGALLESLLGQFERRLETVLPEVWENPQIRRQGREWALLALTRQLASGGRMGKVLSSLQLFPTAYHGELSLQRLDELYAEQGERMYFSSLAPPEVPEGAPPILLLEADVASIVQKRFSDLREATGLLQELRQRELQRGMWHARAVETLALADTAFRLALSELLPGSGWEGEIGLTLAPSDPRLDVFVDRRWLAAVRLPAGFPEGYIGRIQHPQLQANSAWTEPDRNSALWLQLVEALWQHLPIWLAELCAADPSEWLWQRSYHTMLLHERSGPLDTLPLVRLTKEHRVSLVECRAAMEEQRLHLWILEGWVPKDRGSRLLHKLAGHDELFRWWSVRLDAYYAEFQRWSAARPQAVELPHAKDLVCVLDLDQQRGQIGMRPLPASGVQLLAFRGQRPVGQQTLAGLPYILNGLPDGLQVAVDHDGFIPQCSVYEIDVESPSWNEALGWIRDSLPALVEAVLNSRYVERDILAVRLLGWLPRELWPAPDPGPEFCRRLDGTPVDLGEALRRLGEGPPVAALVDAGEVQPLPDFAHVWLISQQLRAEIAAVWGPSRLEDCQNDYLAAWMAVEHGQAQPEPAVLPDGKWIVREVLEVGGAVGELGLCAAAGPANRCQLRLLRHGRILFEHSVPLLERPELRSNYALHCVLEWPDAPVLGTFAQLAESPQGAAFLKELTVRLRLFGFVPPIACREYQWERLAYEAGAQENGNVGFTLERDGVREQLLLLPLFPLEGKLWSLASVLAHVEEEGRLGYVLGDSIAADAGPILYVSARELTWLKLLLRNSHLANLSHLRKALRQQEQRADTPRLTNLPLPDLDYIVQRNSQDVRWGLQREFNGTSRIAVLRGMRPVEYLTFDWRYQLQASLNIDDLQLNSDGTVRRDAAFQARLDALREEVHALILSEAPARFRAELCFCTWGLQEEWVHQLQRQPLLQEARGTSFAVGDWVSAWEPDGALPYLLQEDRPAEEMLALLPARPVALLPADQIAAAAGGLAGVFNYRDGLRHAWQLAQQPELPPPAGATYQHSSPGVQVWADLSWTEQTLRIAWRGRLLHQQEQVAWPGYHLELDWSERLLGQPLPTWADVGAHLAPYRFFLQSVLRNPDLLEETREMWELLPVAPTLEAPPLSVDPSEADLRTLLGRRKAEWQIRERDQFAPVQHVCQRWWGVSVQVELQLDLTEPMRWRTGDDGMLVWLNAEHRWFRGQRMEAIALRATFYLQAHSPKGWREAAKLRAELLHELGLLREEAR